MNSREEQQENELLDLEEHKAAIRNVKERAAFLASSEPDQLQQFYLLRLFSQDSDCPLRDTELKGLLVEARSNISGASRPRMKGEAMDSAPTPWCWEGIVMMGTTNLLVAPPKVGKSALMVGMIGAWSRGEESYLGHRLVGPCPKTFIIGTDQPESDWYTILKREGLVDSDESLSDPIEMLWHTGSPLHLNEKGINELENLAKENPGSLFILDSYHACVSPLGIDEATSAFDGPARTLASALAPHGITLVLIHHTNKSVSGGNATNASRGSNSLPAACSLTILMNWLKQPPEGQTQTDYRVILKTQGRAKGTTAVFELLDDGWISHGDGEQAMAQEARADAELELTGRQADIFDYIAGRWDIGEFPVTASELMDQFRIERNKAHRTVAQLIKKGLVLRCGETSATLDGGRPAGLYRPATPSPETMGQTSRGVINPPSIKERKGLSPLIRLVHDPGGHPFITPTPRTPVERLVDGKWQNGWVIVDGRDQHKIIVAKLGDPQYRIRNLRWDLDVRACTSSPFATFSHDTDTEDQDVVPGGGTAVLSIDSPLSNEPEMVEMERVPSDRLEDGRSESDSHEDPI